jgi:hypothetical protein
MRSPCGAVDHAGDARAAAHAVDAGVAGEAAPDRLLVAQLLDPLRVGEQCAAERNEIGLAAGDGLGRGCRIAEPAHRDHRDLDVLLDIGRIAEERRIGLGHRRDHAVRGRLGAVMSGRDMQRIRPHLRGPDRDGAAFVERQAAVEIIVDRQPVDQARVRRRVADGLQHIKTEAGAVLDVAAKLVGAAVLERRVKLRDQIAVGGVDLDAVEARRHGAARRGHIGADRAFDALVSHRFRHDGLERGLVDRMRNG